jgi:hypothetical protein
MNRSQPPDREPAGPANSADPGLTQAQIDQWVNWYVGGLDNVTNWQMQTLSRLGFTGSYQTVTPGSGTRPSYLTQHDQPLAPGRPALPLPLDGAPTAPARGTGNPGRSRSRDHPEVNWRRPGSLA